MRRLSKSRYAADLQCHKLVWWQVHEPLAVELQPDKVLQDRFDQGAQVGARKRPLTRWYSGRLAAIRLFSSSIFKS